MNNNLQDPYHNAVRNKRKDRELERRKKEFIANRDKAKKFLNKKVYITDFINLPEGLANGIFVGLFVTIPYLLGIIFIFIFFAKADFHIFDKIETSFAFSWVMGYEFLAGSLLLIIFLSSLRFR